MTVISLKVVGLFCDVFVKTRVEAYVGDSVLKVKSNFMIELLWSRVDWYVIVWSFQYVFY